MNYLKRLWEHKDGIAKVLGGAALVFFIVPAILNWIDPSTSILSLSVLNLIFTGFIILSLTWFSIWTAINTFFAWTLDRLRDAADFKDRWDGLPDTHKFFYLFATIWVLFIGCIIAFKPIIFLIKP